VLSNHDNPRHAWRYGRGISAAEADARAKVAAALLVTLRGTPFIYYGEEIGMQDAELSPLDRLDRGDPGVDRDAARTPMQWDAGAQAGFTTARPWLPVASDHQHRNVAAQDGDPRSVLSFYRRLLWLRRESPALQTGGWHPLIGTPRETMAYLRIHADQTMLVVLNFTGRPAEARLDAPLGSDRWIPRASTRRTDVGWALHLGRRIRTGPYEATIFEAVPEPLGDEDP